MIILKFSGLYVTLTRTDKLLKKGSINPLLFTNLEHQFSHWYLISWNLIARGLGISVISGLLSLSKSLQ